MGLSRLGVWLYRAAVARAPVEFRGRYQDEMVCAFVAMLAEERRRRGRWAALILWMRAMGDALAIVGAERRAGREPGGGWRAGLGDDLKYVLRSWKGAKAFAATAIGTIALGLGLNAGIFSFADGFLFRPLPFDDPDDLVEVRSTGTVTGGLALDDYDAIRARDGAGAIDLAHWDLSARIADRIDVDGVWVPFIAFDVSPRFSEILGFRLERGRAFRATDHQELAVVPAWISHRFWRTRLGADPGVMGRTFRTAGWRDQPIEIVGVLPSRLSTFDLNNAPPDVVLPALPRAVPVERRAFWSELPLGRLRPGITREQARQRLQTIVDGVLATSPAGTTPRRIRVHPLRERLVWGGTPTATLLFSVALAILGLVILNVSHLFLARAFARTHEVGLRMTLGASRWRIARLLLTESLAVCATGLTLGLVFGYWLSGIVAARVPPYPTRGRSLAMVPVSFDARVVAFTTALALIVALTAGLAPVWRQARGRSLRLARTPGSARSGLSRRVSSAILAGEVAVATVVLSATLMVGLTVWRVLRQPFGFTWQDVHTVALDLPRSTAPADPLGTTDLTRRLREELALVPGVRAAAFGPWLTSPRETVEKGGRSLRGFAAALRVDHAYFDTLGIRIVAGRSFTAIESDTDAPVAVADEAVARVLWPGVNPIGQQLRVAGADRTIVGVNAHVRRSPLTDVGGLVFVPRAPQAERSATFWLAAPGVPAADVARAATRTVTALVPASRPLVLPVSLERLFRRYADEALFQGPIVAALGALALTVVAVGLFGVVTYVSEQRSREFGIRCALGARPVDLSSVVIRQGAVPALTGLALGLAVTLWTAGWLRTIVPGLDASHLETMLLVAGLILAATLMAAGGPARRAAKVDPVSVIRTD
jgi:putative ABC transport system permease protein